MEPSAISLASFLISTFDAVFERRTFASIFNGKAENVAPINSRPNAARFGVLSSLILSEVASIEISPSAVILPFTVTVE